MKQLVVFSLSVISFVALGQSTTIGLIESTNPYEGYTLFTPEKNHSVYLVNNCGEKINSWEFSEDPGLTCYLLENGNLLRAGKDSLEIRDWDNGLVWSYAMTINGYRQHHDIEPLPNGNILCIVSDIYSSNEMIASGRNPSLLSGNFRLDKIVELEPVGTNDVNLVWEWKFKDHLVQDFDATKDNYGDVMNSPQLININYDNSNTFDWVHLNSVAYNAELDQIVISSRQLSEIYIIDHSTTIEESASHSGGNFGKGGDILWRWGNPQVNGNGSSQDQKLFGQHDAKWVPNGSVDYGTISVFNNFGNNVDPLSSIHLITPVITMGAYEANGNLFLPEDFSWSWSGLIDGRKMYENKKSGVQMLPNGNALICENSIGQLTEIDKLGNVVWRYVNPHGYSIFNQLDTPSNSENSLFRGERYSESFVGFNGKDVSPKGIIENENTISASCAASASVYQNSHVEYSIVNPILDHIKFSEEIRAIKIELYDSNGQLVYESTDFNGNRINLNLKSGIYFLKVVDAENHSPTYSKIVVR